MKYVLYMLYAIIFASVVYLLMWDNGGYGTVTVGESAQMYGMECQTFHHSKGPDQLICFRNDGPYEVFGYKLWDAVVPAFVIEQGRCTSIEGNCPVSF